MSIFSIVLQILLGVGFTLFGVMKFGSKQMVSNFETYGYPAWFRVFSGLVEVAAAILLIAGIWNETLAAWGALLVVATMVGAILTHLKIKDTIQNMMMPFILLVLGAVVLWLHIQHLFG
ncbi:DoxX family protein [Saccharibacillus sacchari]|uniref:DoxX family protein n=1 Tax=Saccharibacillus sacchari TaxID=456493 RepID=A0ACC6PIR5_9BACL